MYTLCFLKEKATKLSFWLFVVFFCVYRILWVYRNTGQPPSSSKPKPRKPALLGLLTSPTSHLLSGQERFIYSFSYVKVYFGYIFTRIRVDEKNVWLKLQSKWSPWRKLHLPPLLLLLSLHIIYPYCHIMYTNRSTDLSYYNTGKT